MEDQKKRNNATITFSDKSQKETLLLQLNSVKLQNLMPDNIKGKDCRMVIWAVDYLYNLAKKGKIRVEVPLFEEDSQEKQQLIEENEQLRKQISHLEQMVRGYELYLKQLRAKIEKQ